MNRIKVIRIRECGQDEVKKNIFTCRKIRKKEINGTFVVMENNKWQE